MKMTWNNDLDLEVDEVAKQMYTEYKTPKPFIPIIENNYYFRLFTHIISPSIMDDEYMLILPNNKLGINMDLFVDTLFKSQGEITNKLLGWWQQAIIPICLYNQNFIDPYTNKSLKNYAFHKIDPHHALITKNDIKSIRDKRKKMLIHNPLNCIVVDHQTHLNHPQIQDRKYNAKLLLNIYGEENKEILERFLLDFPIQTNIKNYYSNLGANNG